MMGGCCSCCLQQSSDSGQSSPASPHKRTYNTDLSSSPSPQLSNNGNGCMCGLLPCCCPHFGQSTSSELQNIVSADHAMKPPINEDFDEDEEEEDTLVYNNYHPQSSHSKKPQNKNKLHNIEKQPLQQSNRDRRKVQLDPIDINQNTPSVLEFSSLQTNTTTASQQVSPTENSSQEKENTKRVINVLPHTPYTLSYYPTMNLSQRYHYLYDTVSTLQLTSEQSSLIPWIWKGTWLNIATGLTSSKPPPGYRNVEPLKSIPMRFHLVNRQFPDIFLEKFGINLTYVDQPINDHVYGTSIFAITPNVYNAMFYIGWLYQELSLYPLSFLKKIGLQNIILGQKLSYDKQGRKAIPIVNTGTLYLDIELEPIYYMQGVFHHELFHLFDDKILLFMKRGQNDSNPFYLMEPSTISNTFDTISEFNLPLGIPFVVQNKYVSHIHKYNKEQITNDTLSVENDFSHTDENSEKDNYSLALTMSKVQNCNHKIDEVVNGVLTLDTNEMFETYDVPLREFKSIPQLQIEIEQDLTNQSLKETVNDISDGQNLNKVDNNDDDDDNNDDESYSYSDEDEDDNNSGMVTYRIPQQIANLPITKDTKVLANVTGNRIMPKLEGPMKNIDPFTIFTTFMFTEYLLRTPLIFKPYAIQLFLPYIMTVLTQKIQQLQQKEKLEEEEKQKYELQQQQFFQEQIQQDGSLALPLVPLSPQMSPPIQQYPLETDEELSPTQDMLYYSNQQQQQQQQQDHTVITINDTTEAMSLQEQTNILKNNILSSIISNAKLSSCIDKTLTKMLLSMVQRVFHIKPYLFRSFPLVLHLFKYPDYASEQQVIITNKYKELGANDEQIEIILHLYKQNKPVFLLRPKYVSAVEKLMNEIQLRNKFQREKRLKNMETPDIMLYDIFQAPLTKYSHNTLYNQYFRTYALSDYVSGEGDSWDFPHIQLRRQKERRQKQSMQLAKKPNNRIASLTAPQIIDFDNDDDDIPNPVDDKNDEEDDNTTTTTTTATTTSDNNNTALIENEQITNDESNHTTGNDVTNNINDIEDTFVPLTTRQNIYGPLPVRPPSIPSEKFPLHQRNYEWMPTLGAFQRLFFASTISSAKRDGFHPLHEPVKINDPHWYKQRLPLRTEPVGSDPLWFLLNHHASRYGTGGSNTREDQASITINKQKVTQTPLNNENNITNNHSWKKQPQNSRYIQHVDYFLSNSNNTGDNTPNSLSNHQPEKLLPSSSNQNGQQHQQHSDSGTECCSDSQVSINRQSYSITKNGNDQDPTIPGFLNTYSMSAIEEDKAEVYSWLIRHPASILCHSDPYLRVKGLELWRRLELFCEDIDHNWYHKLMMHKPFQIDPDHSDWRVHVDVRGYTSWINPKTRQTSWVDPSLFSGQIEPIFPDELAPVSLAKALKDDTNVYLINENDNNADNLESDQTNN